MVYGGGKRTPGDEIVRRFEGKAIIVTDKLNYDTKSNVVQTAEPVAIQGNTDAGIPPVGYLQPGPHQRLNGFQALWFSRGRWGSDDYQRMSRQRCARC